MRTILQAKRGEKGSTTVYLLLCTIFVLLPMAGLAIDVNIMYNVKAKLQTAVDAAAIGAGVTLQRTTDLTVPSQVTAVQVSASKFFYANFPSGYFKSSEVYYGSTPSKDNTGAMSIYVHAAEHVPLLFMHVLGLSQATVTAQSTAKIRYVALMIAVDRSGSVWRAGNPRVIEQTLKTYIYYAPTDPPAGQSVFVDGRDTIGLLSFGGTYSLDYAPSINFKTGTNTLVTAITNMDAEFNTNNSTNTGEGLYQAYYQLKNTINQPGALNVIILLTDGQPTAFSGAFMPTSANCLKANNSNPIKGFINVTVASGPTYNFVDSSSPSGVYKTQYPDGTPVPPSPGTSGSCQYYSAGAGNMPSDISDFPGTAGPILTPDGGPGNQSFSTLGPPGYYTGVGATTSTSSPKNMRVAAYNVADNIATMIRSDTTFNPIIYVIGLNEPGTEEPLNADWLARVANDPDYRTVGSDVSGLTPLKYPTAGLPVLNTSTTPKQTQGKYYNVTAATLPQAFQQIAAQILRLSQ